MSELAICSGGEGSVPAGPLLPPWCGSNNLSDECFASNVEYFVKDIDFEIRFHRHAGRHWKRSFGLHKVESSVVFLQFHEKKFEAVALWSASYETTSLLYLPSSPFLTYLGGIFKTCADDVGPFFDD